MSRSDRFDALLDKFFTNTSTERYHPPAAKYKKPLVHNYFLIHAAAL